MINEQPAITIAQNTTGDRRRFITTLSTAVEGPPRSSDLSEWLVFALMLGVVPGAQIGASLTIRSSERTIRLAFGGFIVLMALVFAATQLLVGR